MNRKQEIECCMDSIIEKIKKYKNQPETYDSVDTLKEKIDKMIESGKEILKYIEEYNSI